MTTTLLNITGKSVLEDGVAKFYWLSAFTFKAFKGSEPFKQCSLRDKMLEFVSGNKHIKITFKANLLGSLASLIHITI